MASRTVTRKQMTASAVEAAATEHAAEVAEMIDARAAAIADELTPSLDFAALQNLLGRLLAADRVAMEAADSAHIEELRDDIEPRERRDAAVLALHERVSRVRSTVETVFGPGSSQRLFALKGLTSRNPEVLRRQAERILDRLRNEAKPLPAPQVSWVSVEPALWAAEIEPALAELAAALKAVYADRRRAEATFRRKRDAIDEHDRTYAAVTSILSGLYRLAKLDIYEERLRPTVPQSGAVDEELPEDQPVPINENESGGGEAPGEVPQPGGSGGEGGVEDEGAGAGEVSRVA